MRERFDRPVALWALVLAVVLVFGAAPVAATYVVILRDGSTVVAKEKYRVQGDRALITLQNGTQTFIETSQIDQRRTEEANRANLGDAVVIPGAPRKITSGGQAPKERKLSDLIVNREAAPRDLPDARRERPSATPGPMGRTRAGYLDLATASRKPYSYMEVATDLQRFFFGQGLEEVQFYEGTQASRPMVEITTASEASVFRALTITAAALRSIQELHPGRVEAFEILMTTPERERAGQFVLTPAMAEELVAKRSDATSFFLRHVQF